jgi:hypothetical protein
LAEGGERPEAVVPCLQRPARVDERQDPGAERCTIERSGSHGAPGKDVDGEQQVERDDQTVHPVEPTKRPAVERHHAP